jgi:hypothetical protein
MKLLMLLSTAFILILVLTFSSSAHQPAQTTAYVLQSEVVSNGSLSATSGGFQLRSTVGQPNVDVLTGGEYRLTSGFWHPVDGELKVFLPMITR